MPTERDLKRVKTEKVEPVDEEPFVTSDAGSLTPPPPSERGVDQRTAHSSVPPSGDVTGDASEAHSSHSRTPREVDSGGEAAPHGSAAHPQAKRTRTDEPQRGGDGVHRDASAARPAAAERAHTRGRDSADHSPVTDEDVGRESLSGASARSESDAASSERPSARGGESTNPSRLSAQSTASENAVAGPVRRLVIRDIDVENFKSYYGQHRIGPFHKTFTAVIGPNGSGKSNVIDSMLFVFGRSAKKIRLEKLSELIHSSAAHPNVSYASVTVNFVRVCEPTCAAAADPTQREEVPDSELRIKREVFRSGISQYYINGQRSTQHSVMERLIAEGVDLEHNRFLILQGEVEQIALMKPKAEREGEEGLLEYLDDLIGTSEYIDRINKATSTAEAAQTARLEALDLERKLKAEREALDAAKNSTLAFVNKDNQLQKTLIVMCQLRMRGIEAKLVEPRKLLEDIDRRIVGFEEDVGRRREAKASAEENVTARKRELAEAAKDCDGVRQRRQTEEGLLEKLRCGVDEQERATGKLADQVKRCKEEIQKAALQQQDAERESTIHQQNLDEAATLAEQLQQQHDTLSQELLPKLRPLRQQLEQRKRDVAPFELGATEAAEAVSTASRRLEASDEAEKRKTAQVAAVERQRDERVTRMEQVQKLLDRAEESDSQKAELLHLQDQLTEATQRKYAVNNSINEMKGLYREGEQDDRAMEFLLSQRALKGYYGTLRQLGRIEDAFDTAAGVASNAWGFHVVEDRATATAALEALKRHNMGRATMMVVSEIDREMGERAGRPFTAPNAKARRLFDLITPTNAKFRSVFYQAVRDTLVVPTLTEARESAFGGGQRFRVVTMKGELVEPNGTVTGGGASPRGARLKAARSPQDKQAIKEELQRLQQELVQAAEDEKACQVRLHALYARDSLPSPEELRKLRTEQQSLTAAVEVDRQRIDALKTEVASLLTEAAARRTELQAELTACEGRLTAATEARDRHRDEVRALEQRVEEEGGSAFRSVSEQLKTQSARQDAEESALRACRRLAQKLRATQERKEKDLAEHTAALQKLRAEAEEGIKEKVAEHIKQVEELTAQLNRAEAQLARAQSASESARAAVPLASSALVEAQKCLDEETRYRMTESAKMADALQELAKFEQKIEGCEEKIKENAELYGLETLQLGDSKDAQDGENEEDEEDDGDEEEEEDEEEEMEEEEEEEEGGQGVRRHAAPSSRPTHSKRPRRGRAAGAVSRRDGAAKEADTAAAQIRTMTFKLSPDELDCCDYERSVHLAKALSEETKRLHSDIDFRAVALWRERDVAHRQALAVYEEKKQLSDHADLTLLDLKEERRDAFLAVFNRIRRKLKEVYQLLTHGGDADMELVDVNDPFEGVHFVVRPPKKSWKQISNLSGGEKTLSSLALIFSLHHIKPTPIYVMDEIDAALDFRNVSIVANYVLRQASGAQFIIISLRNNMFELAHQLVGVCKVHDVTSTLVLMPLAFRKTVQQRVAASIEGRRQSDTKGRPRQDTQPSQASAGRSVSPAGNAVAEALDGTAVASTCAHTPADHENAESAAPRRSGGLRTRADTVQQTAGQPGDPADACRSSASSTALAQRRSVRFTDDVR